MNVLLGGPIFRGYVSFGEGNSSGPLSTVSDVSARYFGSIPIAREPGFQGGLLTAGKPTINNCLSAGCCVFFLTISRWWLNQSL